LSFEDSLVVMGYEGAAPTIKAIASQVFRADQNGIVLSKAISEAFVGSPVLNSHGRPVAIITSIGPEGALGTPISKVDQLYQACTSVSLAEPPKDEKPQSSKDGKSQ
jgi:hypothetical protein